jgi:hypothetical protein
MKLSKEKQQHLIIVVVGTVVVVVALYFLLISRFQANLKQLDEQIGKARDAVATANKSISEEKYRLPELMRLTNVLGQIESSMMPTNEIFSTFRSSFNQFKGQYTGRVEIMDVSKEKLLPLRMMDRFPYGTAVFSVRGWAHYHDFGRFLADFETRFPYCRISQVSLNAQALDSPAPEKLAFDMDIVTLIRPIP